MNLICVELLFSSRSTERSKCASQLWFDSWTCGYMRDFDQELAVSAVQVRCHLSSPLTHACAHTHACSRALPWGPAAAEKAIRGRTCGSTGAGLAFTGSSLRANLRGFAFTEPQNAHRSVSAALAEKFVRSEKSWQESQSATFHPNHGLKRETCSRSRRGEAGSSDVPTAAAVRSLRPQ